MEVKNKPPHGKSDEEAQKDKGAEKDKGFFLTYKRWFIISFCFALIGYIVIYFFFLGQGFIPAGNDLKKSDWLSFLSGYLSFSGTIAVALVASLQSHFYAQKEEVRKKAERHEQIQPIFSIEIAETDTAIDGSTEATQKFKHPAIAHKNFKFLIKNAGQYPVKHLIIFEKYISPLMECGASVSLQCAFSDSPDMKIWPERLIELATGEYARDEGGLPKEFQICYEDIDGASMYQAYSLSNFDGKKYYSLICKEEV